jgi:hypothetical protein
MTFPFKSGISVKGLKDLENKPPMFMMSIAVEAADPLFGCNQSWPSPGPFSSYVIMLVITLFASTQALLGWAPLYLAYSWCSVVGSSDMSAMIDYSVRSIDYLKNNILIVSNYSYDEAHSGSLKMKNLTWICQETSETSVQRMLKRKARVLDRN